VAGVVLVSPYDSLVEIGRQHYPWLPVGWLLRHRFDSTAAARRVTVPLLTLVGTADSIVAPRRSRALHEAWGGPKTWVAIEGAGHNDLDASPDYWDAIGRFLGTIARLP
jgi:pimeloyl-ACP methyl ester carboxylesterase